MRILRGNLFTPITTPYMHGVEALSDSGLLIQVVECYPFEWDVFICLNDQVVACSVNAYRQWKHGTATKTQAMKVAIDLLTL